MLIAAFRRPPRAFTRPSQPADVDPQQSLIVGENCAATEWISEGIQTGPLGELPASGNSFRLRGASILKLRDDKIASVADYYDRETFLRQLGDAG